MRYKCARAFTNGPHFFLANDDDSSLNWTTEIFKNEKEGVITHTHTHLHAPQRPFALLDCRMLRRRPKVRVSACTREGESQKIKLNSVILLMAPALFQTQVRKDKTKGAERIVLLEKLHSLQDRNLYAKFKSSFFLWEETNTPDTPFPQPPVIFKMGV